MNPEVEMLASDAGDTRMKFRLGEDLTRVVHQTAKEFDVEEELVLELILFERLYGNFCLRCGELNPASARFCQRCGMEVEKNENNPTVVNLSAIKVLVVDENGGSQ